MWYLFRGAYRNQNLRARELRSIVEVIRQISTYKSIIQLFGTHKRYAELLIDSSKCMPLLICASAILRSECFESNFEGALHKCLGLFSDRKQD